VATWGGYIFVVNVIAAHAAVLVGLGRYSSSLHRAYSIFFIVGTFGAVQIPSECDDARDEGDGDGRDTRDRQALARVGRDGPLTLLLLPPPPPPPPPPHGVPRAVVGWQPLQSLEQLSGVAVFIVLQLLELLALGVCNACVSGETGVCVCVCGGQREKEGEENGCDGRGSADPGGVRAADPQVATCLGCPGRS
jgi:hypothetical protein